MTNPTSNFGWQMPTSTDLVTDLPADFEVFGQAVDTSLADLKGGTTGQVLSKASNTNMDFTWVTTDDANAIQNTIVDAKGDLISATGSDVPARLAVGANGETLVADSSTSTGLRYTAGNPIPNPIINSAFQVWQRGTTFAISNTNTFTADRWVGLVTTAATTSFSRQTTGDTTNLPNIQYCMRVQRANGQTATPLLALEQSFETVNSIPYAGKTVTYSFYARAGANYSSASNALKVYVYTGTGTDQSIRSGYTGVASPIDATATLTTTWQRFTYTGTIAATATEIALQFQYTATGTAGAADFFEVTGVQLDIGSVALPFRTNGATIQGELDACIRYFERYAASDFGDLGTIPQSLLNVNNSNLPEINVLYSRKRVKPTMTFSNGNGFQVVNVTAGNVFRTTSFYGTFSGTGLYSAGLVFNATWTAGQVTILEFYDANQYIDISAEL
jgi:hypothetical protein